MPNKSSTDNGRTGTRFGEETFRLHCLHVNVHTLAARDKSCEQVIIWAVRVLVVLGFVPRTLLFSIDEADALNNDDEMDGRSKGFNQNSCLRQAGSHSKDDWAIVQFGLCSTRFRKPETVREGGGNQPISSGASEVHGTHLISV